MKRSQVNTIMSIDLSTTCTGIAVFTKDNQLVEVDIIKGKNKKTDAEYPEKQLLKMYQMCEEVVENIMRVNPDVIVIEEIAGSKNRMGQKTLDGVHWILAHFLYQSNLIRKVVYYDVTGADGWRTHIKLRLSDEDKEHNKEAKKTNKIIAGPKIPIIGTKHLSCRYANFKYGTDLDYDLRTTDGDKADAVCMGSAFIKVYITTGK